VFDPNNLAGGPNTAPDLCGGGTVTLDQNITISSTAPASAIVGSTYTVNVAASSGLPVALTTSPATVCTVDTSTKVVTFTGKGVCTIFADQAGGTGYNPAAQKTQSFTITGKPQTLNLSTPPSGVTATTAAFTVTATATSGLPVTYSTTSAASVCTVSPAGLVTPVGNGTCVVTANQPGDATTWEPASVATLNIPIGLTPQNITFTSPATTALAGTTATVAAGGGGSGNPVTFSSGSTAICTVAGTTVNFLTAGNCLINAAQAGNAAYAAGSAQQTVVVSRQTQTIAFGAQAGRTYAPAPGNTFALNPVATSPANNVTYSSLTPAVCAISGTTVTMNTAGTCTIAADSAATTVYNAATQATQTITIAKAAQNITITSVAPSAPTVGQTYTVTTTNSAGLPVTLAVSGGACSLTGTTVTFTAAGTCTVTASNASTASYEAGTSAPQTITVANTNHTVTFTSTPPSPAVVGQSYTVSATANPGGLAVTAFSAGASTGCSVAGNVVTFTGIGSCTITASQPARTGYNAADAAQTFAVEGKPQLINFDAGTPDTANAGDPAFTVTATATSGLTPVTFGATAATTASICTVTPAGLVTPVGVGDCVITADRAGDSTWADAPQAQWTVAIGKTAQTITFNAPPTPWTVGVPITLSATASSGLTVAFTVDPSSATVCVVTGTQLTLNTTGACTVNANQAGNATYAGAPQVQQLIKADLLAQTITFGAQPGQTYAPAPNNTFALNPAASATSGLSVTYTSLTTAVCSISGTTVTMLTAGTCTIAADQSGDGTYAAAARVPQDIAIVKANQTISFGTTPPNPALVGANYTVSASANSGLPLTTLTAAGDCTLAGSTVTFAATLAGATGTCTVTATQAGDGNYNPVTVTQPITVSKMAQAIVFSSTPPNPAIVNTTYTVAVAANSGLPLTTLTATGSCNIAGSLVTFSATPGVCTVTATQTGNGSYAPATTVTQTINVASQATQTVSFSSTPPNPALVGATYTVAAYASSGLPLTTLTATGSCGIAGSLVTFSAPPGTCTVTATQAGNATYAAATDTQVITVMGVLATPVITSTPPPPPITAGTTYQMSVTFDPLGGAVTYSVDPASTPGACTTTPTGLVTFGPATTGNCIIGVVQAGSAFYGPVATRQFIPLGLVAAGATGIPTLGQWTLALLVALLALSSPPALRRRAIR
jgi:hypothetical protein